MKRTLVVAAALAVALPTFAGVAGGRDDAAAGGTMAAPFKLEPRSVAPLSEQAASLEGKTHRASIGGLVAIADVAPQPEGRRPAGIRMLLVTDADADAAANKNRPNVKVLGESLPSSESVAPADGGSADHGRSRKH